MKYPVSIYELEELSVLQQSALKKGDSLMKGIKSETLAAKQTYAACCELRVLYDAIDGKYNNMFGGFGIDTEFQKKVDELRRAIEQFRKLTACLGEINMIESDMSSLGIIMWKEEFMKLFPILFDITRGLDRNAGMVIRMQKEEMENPISAELSELLRG